MKNSNKAKGKARFPGLTHRNNSKSSSEYVDYDYLDRLSEKELQYLSNFTEEYLRGNFQHPKGKKIHRSKAKRKSCYANNNSRNRDILSRAKSGNLLRDITTIKEKSNKDDYENYLNSVLDLFKKRDTF